MNVKAMFYSTCDDKAVNCYLCPHNCVIKQGNTGICRVRKNIDGELYSLNYGKVSSLALDPIEKKPLFRFYPGSYILSAGSFGCNFKCSFCQNWTIPHETPDTADIPPDKLVAMAEKYKREGNIGIAYTYNEPTIWYEFVYETSRLAKEKGLKNILVTNGYISREPLEQILPYIDAMNIDVKSFNPSFYKNICRGSLENIKETVEISAKKCHVEVTTLLIPGHNDTDEEIEALSQWLSSISDQIVLHLTRYFPNYRMSKPPTPYETLERAKRIALSHLKYVYLGNVF